jgi:hypothetical protein
MSRLPPACTKRRKHLFFLFSISLDLFATYSLVHCSTVLILRAITMNLPSNLVVRVKVTLEDGDGDGTEIRKACESGRCRA